MSHHPNGPLLRLPRELRDQIYILVFTHDPLVRIFENGTSTQSFPTLLQTCQQVYAEAYPMLIRSLKFVISSNAALDATQRWLVQKGPNGLKNVRAIAITSFPMFRTFPPGQRCMLWDPDECLPLPRVMRIGPKVHVTGSDAPSASHATIPKAIRFLLTLPGLRHIEIGIHVKIHTDAVDRAQRGERHYYDLCSLTSITTLKSVTLDLNSHTITKLYNAMFKKKEEDWKPNQVRLKEVLEDAWGLRSWLQEGFQEKSLDVDVRCVWYRAEAYTRAV